MMAKISLPSAALLKKLTALVSLSLFISSPLVPAQDKAEETTEETSEEEAPIDSSSASLTTLGDARVMTFTYPAPRGLITDRNGITLAQNKIWYEMGILFGQQPDEAPEAIVTWARERIKAAITLTGKSSWAEAIKDEDLVKHYEHRRWLPFTFPGLFNDTQRKIFTKSSIMKKNRGLVMHGQYLRYYPQKSSAAHIVGYVRPLDRDMPTGPITDGESVFLKTTGTEGLEKTMDDFLKGVDGKRNLRVDSNGKTIVDERIPAKAGNTIVTTINSSWQKTAESILRGSARRGGAFVVVDVHSGEILVLASNPSYDINVWVPKISVKDADYLFKNEYKPLFARAFQAVYPPASGFKPIVAATGMTIGTFGEGTYIDCPAKLRIGEKWFRNHSKTPDGKINVCKALARSNNVFFYKTGIMMGDPFLTTARRCGFGTRTTNELYNEKSGFVPSHEWAIEKFGRKLTQGQLANYAIGQGEFQATPLQVAQGMAAIGNGKILPRLHIIKQVQDLQGRVLRAAQPEQRNLINLDPYALKVTRKGMMQVVYASYGTGKQGAPSYSQICGKTGTAEWYGNRRLAWFSGFIPYHNPRYAFAAVYEGYVGQRPSGGKYAAPMVGRFLNAQRSSIQQGIRPAAKAQLVKETVVDEDKQANEVLNALPLNEGEEN